MLRYSKTTKALWSEVPTAIGLGTRIVCVSYISCVGLGFNEAAAPSAVILRYASLRFASFLTIFLTLIPLYSAVSMSSPQWPVLL